MKFSYVPLALRSFAVYALRQSKENEVAGRVVRMGVVRNACKILSGKLRGKEITWKTCM